MADEITVSAGLGIENGHLRLSDARAQFTDDQAAAVSHATVQAVGTSDEAMSTGDVATPGWVVMINFDDTNYVEFGVRDSGGSFIPLGVLPPGAPCEFKVASGATIYLKANTAACFVRVFVADQ